MEPYTSYSDVMEDEEIRNPAMMLNETNTNMIMKIGNVPDDIDDDDSDTPPSRLDSLRGTNDINDGINRPNDLNGKSISNIKEFEPIDIGRIGPI